MDYDVDNYSRAIFTKTLISRYLQPKNISVKWRRTRFTGNDNVQAGFIGMFEQVKFIV